jgi:hypothetical protein
MKAVLEVDPQERGRVVLRIRDLKGHVVWGISFPDSDDAFSEAMKQLPGVVLRSAREDIDDLFTLVKQVIN